MRELQFIMPTIFFLAMSSFLSLGYAQFAGGSGTQSDPWLIAEPQHLDSIRNYLGTTNSNKCFKLISNIDLGVAPWNVDQGWVPIGSSSNRFYGKLDGDYHVIQNLKIVLTSNSGLFGYSNGIIQKIGLENVDINGTSNVAPLVSWNKGSVYHCFSTGYVTGTATNTGGLIAVNEQGSVSQCYSHAIVQGYYRQGGFLGMNSGSVVNCYSTGSVTGTGGGDTGGFLGISYYNGIMTNCYSVGLVIDTNRKGLIGSAYTSTITNCYWDLQTSNSSSSSGGSGRYTHQMVYPNSTDTYQGWDWAIWMPDILHTNNIGYPTLRMGSIYTQAPEHAEAITPSNGSASILLSAQLSWKPTFTQDNTDCPTGYLVSLGTDNPPTNIINEQNLGYVHSFNVSQFLAHNTAYYWQIIPFNNIGQAINSPVWSFTTYSPSFSFIEPIGSEIWISGTTKTIKWSINSPPNLSLSVTFDGGSNWSDKAIIDGTLGSYQYQVDSVDSDSCAFKLRNTQNQTEFTVSDFITISTSTTHPKLTLTYPSASNLHFNVGQSITVTWLRQNVQLVDISYSINNGISWIEVISSLNAGEFTWIVPDTPSTMCQLRINSHSDYTVCDYNDNLFTISRIQLLSPNGSEIFTADYSYIHFIPISYYSEGMNSVKIECLSLIHI